MLFASIRVRLMALTPETVCAALPWSLSLSAAVSLAIIGIAATTQPRTDVSQSALAWTVLVGVAVAVVAAAPWGGGRIGGDHRGVVAWLLALHVAIALLVVPVYLAAWPSEFASITGWRTYTFFNKRWLAALYLITVGTALVLPLWWHRALTNTHDETPVVAPRPAMRRPVAIVQVLLLLAAVWYLAGPPWNVGEHHRPVDLHEQVHLGPLQAIAKGAVPYLGPASTQYGPGAQLFLYTYMRWTDQFTLIGFREAFLAVHLAVMAIFVLLAFAYAGGATASLVLLLGLLASPLRFFLSTGDGSMGESYGWGNAARYLATIVVVPAVALLLTRPRSRARLTAGLLGVAWGVLSWYAQENLASGAMGLALVVLTLLGGRATSWSRVREVMVSFAAGAAVPVLLVLGWYTVRADVGQFVGNYFLLPRAVSAGYQNTWFAEAGNPLARTFHVVPLFGIVVGCLTLWDPWTCRPRTLGPAHVRLVAFVCALLSSFQGALFRSDALHTINVLLPLPFVAVFAFRDLPGWLARGWLARAAWHTGIALFVLWMLPISTQLFGAYDWILGPAIRRHAATASPHVPLPGVGFQRASATLADEPIVAGANSGPMHDFLADASALHDLVGRRPTVVQGAGPYFTGLVYFMADLTPAPILYDVETMVINDRIQSAAWAHLRKHIGEVDCVIATSPSVFEAQVFLAANPSVSVRQVRLGATQVYVMMVDE